LIEGQPLSRGTLGASRWRGKGWVNTGDNYESTPGTGPATQRVKEQDMDRVAAEVLFPAVHGPKFWRSIADDNAYKSVVRAYNTWLAEDYCSESPKRLIGVGVIPWTGVDDSIAEMEKCAKMGLRVVALGRFPNGQGQPTQDDDRFWAAAVDMRMPITIHVELDRGPSQSGRVRLGSGVLGQVSNDKFCRLGGTNAVQLIFAGVFDRFPNLHIDFVENQIGWLPHFYEQADERYKRHLTLVDEEGVRLQRLPSEYLREHTYWGFQENPVGVRLRHEMGVDRLIWGSDFPHQETAWPDSMDVIAKNFEGVPEDETYRMVCGNVVEFFHLEDCLPAWEASREGTVVSIG
jgi:predicted TIM-barrel fold metal-dependent hydrolase